ncbi:leucyl aminopeptidase family protein [Pseudoblastomonas halimionae]|uniref:Leucyl aminopeptidase family protein n=1 Tax=Alteriqipengyuania halimionae TaxID=1926630 RepID=A0A6I4U2K2_9SPHN|nr:leucyl aminopeptidase family protein [Alteriqipengyuania halimionae]MXP10148.1 leucyl aminopeptidase family protein [Alteriqipengyuania halimionae]
MSETTQLIQPDRGQDAIAIHLINADGFDDWAKSLTEAQRNALAAQRFSGKGYEVGIVPAKDGKGWFAVGGVANPKDLSSWCMAALAEKLPEGTYRRADDNGGGEPGPALYGWMTAQHSFARYKSDPDDRGPRVLLTKEAAKIDALISEAEAANLVADLVNTPAEDLGPEQLEDVARDMADRHKASISVIKGDALERDYPMVHAVGRAAARSHAPRLIEIEWGDESHPRVAVIGKGVVFDSGGLDVKSAAGMKLMKKDMGGSAHALALGRLIMENKLPVRLHLLVPAVENAISSNSFRPGDVLKSRKGITVEITNTDAEGRLILGDALTRASEKNPDFMIDFATLTGAARVAVGPDLPALFTREDETAQQLIEAGRAHDDEPWRLPLADSYREWLNSDIADMANAHANSFAGASVAGLFLDKFVGDGIDWAHFDTFAWRPAAKPGRPKGGAALGLRAAWHMLKARYA